MITCGWCRLVHEQWQEHCSACGGALPPLRGKLGSPPEPSPRRLPRGFSARQWWSQNSHTTFGLIFFCGGGMIATAFFLKGSWVALVPGFFMVAGVSGFCRGALQAKRVLRAYRHGRHTEGRVDSIERDPLYVGQKGFTAPWIFTYRFEDDGVERKGSFSTLNDCVRSYAAGDPVWVLYVPGHAAASTIYPPLI